MDNIEQLYQKLSNIDIIEFWRVEADFAGALWRMPKKPLRAIAYLTIVNWLAMSVRQGVWTFYEAEGKDSNNIQSTVQYLKQSGEQELADIFVYGLHDYHNSQHGYGENQILYPEEWIEEALKIDNWISAHEEWLYQWERDLLIKNKDLLCLS
ncbi:hypothetical protein U6B65_04970 [Oscillospiraceae bacterium MB08-C2-2]|nr:hypothetical protein U6B65_04970 [Oscillospiraceae bacterium MB08-C2-2]